MFKLIIYINELQKARQQAASCHNLRFDKNVSPYVLTILPVLTWI